MSTGNVKVIQGHVYFYIRRQIVCFFKAHSVLIFALLMFLFKPHYTFFYQSAKILYKQLQILVESLLHLYV